MATKNFCNKNASKIYALEIQDEFIYNDTILNIAYELQAQTKNKNEYDFSFLNRYDNDRNYSGKYFFELTKSFTYCNLDFNIVFRGVVRDANYVGTNFDYDLEFAVKYRGDTFFF